MSYICSLWAKKADIDGQFASLQAQLYTVNREADISRIQKQCLETDIHKAELELRHFKTTLSHVEAAIPPLIQAEEVYLASLRQGQPLPIAF
jgi:hypothetical protein